MARSERPGVLLNKPLFAISRLGRVVRDGIKEAFDREKLSWRGYIVLECLAGHGPMAQRELSDLIAMDPSDLVKLLDELERAGEVRRDADPADRRRRLLSLAPGGARALERGERVVERATAEILGRLDAQERASLHRLALRALGAEKPAKVDI
ncbi:MarR family winged helix-turn-helix transcriptional regulator [Fodinicola acaciae]|uniref:MarR family winged helix-turn-helix transcriptional regulator n=1 Tax=Fodinicola acaciae TaxID=2681555 RepID=UPI0013D6DEAE|nr:MarR family transcriptional regulator [Fodinicola acaciae]